MGHLTRLTLPIVEPTEEANIRPHYPLEQAAWIWHPERPAGHHAILRFSCNFTAPAGPVRIHLSADQRYDLRLDGELISRGPDRGDLAHWAFASYELELTAGEHRLEAMVWWIGDFAPVAQITHRGGFIFAAEGDFAEQLNTGTGAWQVQALRGWSFEHRKPLWFTGAGQIFTGGEWHEPEPATTPAVIYPPLQHNQFGAVRHGWRLHPSRLPDQLSQPWRQGRVRTAFDGAWQPETPMPAECDDPDWQRLLTGQGAITIPPQTRRTILWDFDDYLCAYWHAVLAGGAGATLTTQWSEGLYVEPPRDNNLLTSKGNRDEIAGKYFASIQGDTIHADGGDHRAYSSYWWRAGRYLLIEVQTADEPLTIKALQFEENRYPLDLESCFTSSNDVDAMIPMYLRGMQMCSHETYMDCPYYEQLMYIGDTRLEMLAWYAMSSDDRLPMRAIELFDWSRCYSGAAAEHYPGRDPQQSTTYAMIWPMMLHDFARWRHDPDFVRRCMPGMRGNLEVVLRFLRDDSLLGHLPGWSFVDWVDAWNVAVPPMADDELSATINLHLVLALQAAAELEEYVGDRFMAQRYRAIEQDISLAIRRHFWDDSRALFAENSLRDHYSEHAQCLALIARILPQEEAARCFASLLAADDLAPTSIYFSWYLLEVYHQFGRGDLIEEALDYWRGLLAKGLRTPQEAPEPTRSDCHAWGSHPLFHYHASLAGIRPADWGFDRVEIAPVPGPLKHLHSRLPHPAGWLDVELTFDNGTCHARIEVPENVHGNFVWQQQVCQLVPGRQSITIIPEKRR